MNAFNPEFCNDFSIKYDICDICRSDTAYLFQEIVTKSSEREVFDESFRVAAPLRRFNYEIF